MEFSSALEWIGSDSSSVRFADRITSLLSVKKEDPCLLEVFSGLRKFLLNLLDESLSLWQLR